MFELPPPIVYIHIDIDHPTNQPLRLVLYFQGLVAWDLMFDDLEEYDEGLLFCSSVCLGVGLVFFGEIHCETSRFETLIQTKRVLLGWWVQFMQVEARGRSLYMEWHVKPPYKWPKINGFHWGVLSPRKKWSYGPLICSSWMHFRWESFAEFLATNSIADVSGNGYKNPPVNWFLAWKMPTEIPSKCHPKMMGRFFFGYTGVPRVNSHDFPKTACRRCAQRPWNSCDSAGEEEKIEVTTEFEAVIDTIINSPPRCWLPRNIPNIYIFLAGRWLNQQIWKILHSQVGSFPQSSGWT